MTNKLKCMYWNIHGISSKILWDKSKNPEFLKKISEGDIIWLSELHTDKCISIPGFAVIKQKIRPKHHKGPKIGGGIAVLIKQELLHKFKLIHNDNIDSIWVKMINTQDKNNDVHLGFYYCSPETNNTSNFFEIVNHEMNLYNNKNTFIFGDFNARIKTEEETIIQDKFDEVFGIETEIQS